MGTLVVYTAVGTQTVQIACAQDAGGAVRSGVHDTSGQLPLQRFEIPPGLFETVLRSFETATHLQIVVSNEGIRSLASPGVSGLYTVEQALQKLLGGTGVDYRFTGPVTVTLHLKELSSTIDVTDVVSPLATSLPKYAGPLRETPQSITAVPRQVLDAQSATTLRDALRNVSGISLAAGEGGAQGDNLTIRGFSARNDLFIDGMRDFGSYYRDPFDMEEVEVLQGPSSVAFGRGSTGGVVNQASKTPRLDQFLSGDADFGTDLTRRVTLDVGAPLRKLGAGAAFRLNLMGDVGHVAGRDVAENRRFGLAPSMALGLGTPTRWTFGYFHQTADDIPDYGVPWLFNGPAPVNRQNYYGFKDGNYLRTYDDIGTAKVEHDVNSHITVRDQVRYANYVRHGRITEAQIPSTVTLATPLSSINVNRNEITVDSVETYLAEQLDVSAVFNTGFLRHTLVTGVEAGRETSDPTRFQYKNVPTTSLLNPDPDQPFSGLATVTSRVNTNAVSDAGYVLDTVGLGEKWQLTGGVRWDRFDTDYRQSVGSLAAFQRIDTMPTWRAAAVYKPAPVGSIYFAAGTSFNPSAESLSLSASNANLPPEKNTSYELGTKWDLSRGNLSLRSALFRTEKTNAREPDPNNPVLNVLAGDQRVNGVQVEARGHLTSRWEILAGYAYLDARLVDSKFYPAAVGARLANVPENTFNFWNSYRLPWNWEAGLGANYVSSRAASSTVPFDPATGLVKQVPSYWIFSAMARHRLAEHLDLQVNVNNLANRYYYDELHPAHIVLGPGRSAMAGLKFKF